MNQLKKYILRALTDTDIMNKLRKYSKNYKYECYRNREKRIKIWTLKGEKMTEYSGRGIPAGGRH